MPLLSRTHARCHRCRRSDQRRTIASGTTTACWCSSSSSPAAAEIHGWSHSLPFLLNPHKSKWNPNLVSIYAMELYLCWMMVSSDCMIRVETSLMNELNQNKDSLVEPHLYLWQCRMLGVALAVPHSTEWISKYRCCSIDDSLFWLDLCTRCISILNM